MTNSKKLCHSFQRYLHCNPDAKRFGKKHHTNPVMNFLLNVGWVMIIFVGAVRVNAGLTAPGKIIAFLTYFTIILNAMLSITRLFVMFSRAGSSAERIEEILQARSDIKNQDANDNKSCDESLPYIVFDNVSFSYNGNVDNLS